MEKVVEVRGITVNVGEVPVRCQGMEGEIGDAIAALNGARRSSEAADPPFRTLLSLHKRGVIFPSRLMFLVETASVNRVPSLEAMSSCAGVREIYEALILQWKFLGNDRRAQAYVRRVLINLTLSTTCANVLEMPAVVFTAIIRSWKEPDGTFQKVVAHKTFCVPAINNIARLLSHHNNNATYEVAIRQPRSDNTWRQAGGAEFILANPNAENTKWVELFNEWLHSQNLKNTKRHKSSFVMLLEWLKLYPNEVSKNPLLFLSQLRHTPSLMAFMKDANDVSNDAIKAATYLNKFLQWIIDSYMRDVDEDGAVSIGVHPLSYSDLEVIQGAWDTGGKPSESTSKPLPTAWRLKVQKILTEDDHAWPKSLSNQYFPWLNPETGEYEMTWCPTLTYLFETMLELPLRRIQVQCLDSGEGDETLYDPPTCKWVTNTGPAAGYWKKDPAAKVKHRGVIRDFSKAGNPLVGFYINTNKTADKNAPSGERAGYAIPWQNETVINLFTTLRMWQEKHNPQTVPLPYSAVSKKIFGYDATELAIKQTPDRFYLFRTPCGKGHRLLPVTYAQCFTFWNELMAELERRLKNEGEDVTIVEKWNLKTGQPQQTAFNIHGLRVATLTAFAEAGVPIEILSKILAGHSSILMTLYYLKFNEVSISQLLCDKAVEIRGNAAEQLRKHLENKSWERAKKLAVFNDEECFRSVMSSRFRPGWSNEGYGICPHGGTRCDDGGPAVKDGKYAIHGPVPGGKHNCLRCRHFISGAPFLIQMWMKTNKLLADSQKMATEYDEFLDELRKLEDEKYCMAKSGENIPVQIKARIKELEGVCDTRASSLNETLLNLHVAWRLTECIKALISEDTSNDNNLPALLSSSSTDLEFGHREGTRFEAISYILQASRIYPVLHDEYMELERERFLNTIFIRENLMPLCLQPLTEQEKRRAADAASVFLLTKVGAEEAQQVYEGKITLKELGFSGAIVSAMAEAAPALLQPGDFSPTVGDYLHG